ncbi:MAG: PAS domain-containing sensor histidine kinase [Pseudomonadota bacterium]
MLEKSCSDYQASTGGFNAQLFDSSADCIKILDLDGNVSDLNLGGVRALELDDPDMLTGRRWVEFWPDDVRAQVAQAVASGLKGETAQFGAFCPTSKGNARWWDVVVTPIRDAAGVVSQLMVVSRDVTDLYLAREALQDANRRKDEFLALLSHELRNPLSAAGMAASVLQTQQLTPARVVEIGNLIQRQVAHMSRMAEDLLDVSRVTRGEVSLKMEPVEIKDVVRSVLEQVHATCQAKGQHIDTALSEAPCLVLGDKTRLVQIIANIVGNSIRYSPQGGMIELSLNVVQDEVVLTVSDSGIGIAAADIPTLFDLYKQGMRDDGERKSGGLGIGLALVRSLVELHGGSVVAYSEGLGMGSRFVVRLPSCGA